MKLRISGLVAIAVLILTTAVVSASHAASLTTLVNFNGTNGADPFAGLIADAAGDLFGTTPGAGTNGDGTVFEIAKTGGSYASTPTTLVSFNGTDGAAPYAGLIADAAGDLFGTTRCGRGERRWHGVRDRQDRRRLRQHADHTGQLQRHQRGNPDGGLIADAAGDLFGTTVAGRTRCWDERRWHGVRDREQRRRHATRRPHWSASTAPTGQTLRPV